VLSHKADPRPSTFVTERKKIMTRHGSASPRKEESLVPRKQVSTGQGELKSAVRANAGSALPVIDANVKRRARQLITNSRIPSPTRGMLRYALEIKDPYLPQLVRRVESGELIIDYLEKIDTPFGTRPAP
jgi:hypothetical protein